MYTSRKLFCRKPSAETFIRAYAQFRPKVKKNEGKLLISCKRKEFDFYTGTFHNKFDEIPLASAGWKHNRSKGDNFTVHPHVEDSVEFKPFSTFGVNPQVIDVLKSQGITEATLFQSEAIPIVRDGKHVLIAAETGCGKTISYLIPIVENLMSDKQKELNTPRALIIVPNRELAEQIGGVASALSEPLGLNVKTVIGGNTKSLMMNPEVSDVDILVGTPGALAKLSTVGVYKLHDVRYTVLDEADTLMDDSFEDRVTSLIKRVSRSQIVLVSATYPKRLLDVLLPVENDLIDVISPRLHRPLLNISQKFLRLTRSLKPSELLSIAKHNKQPMLVFTNRNETCNWLAMFLRENGLSCANINGDMNRHIRIAQWGDFVSGRANVLSATDVGSRGLNTTQIKHVVNYDFPHYMADYIHRIGRTGRLGSPEFCKVTNFVSGVAEVELVQKIELAIRKSEPLPDVDGNTTNIFQKYIHRQMRQQSALKE